MTAPAKTKELREAIRAAIELVSSMHHAVDESSPGGKRITLEELLNNVTDGKVRESLAEFYNAIVALSKGSKAAALTLPAKAVKAAMELVGQLKLALADGRVTPDEIVNGVTDGHMRKSLQDAIDGIDKIPSEIKSLDFMEILDLVQDIMDQVGRWSHASA